MVLVMIEAGKIPSVSKIILLARQTHTCVAIICEMSSMMPCSDSSERRTKRAKGGLMEGDNETRGLRLGDVTGDSMQLVTLQVVTLKQLSGKSKEFCDNCTWVRVHLSAYSPFCNCFRLEAL